MKRAMGKPAEAVDGRLACACALSVFVVVFLAFSRSLDGEFINWDDFGLVVQNRNLGFSAENLRWMFTSSYHGTYQPIGWLSLSLDQVFWGLDPFGFHLTANLLHALAAALLFYWARDLATYLRPQQSVRWQLLGAVTVALLFALHPLRVENISWISQRRDQLAGLFTVIGLLFYHRAVLKFPDQKIPFRCLAPTLTSLLLACLSKPSAVTIVAVLCVLDLYVYQRFSSLSPWQRIWRSGLEKYPIWLVSLGMGVVAVFSAKYAASSMMPFSVYGIEPRLALSCLSLVLMLKLIFFPIGLYPLVELRFMPSFSQGPELVSLIILGVITLGLGWRKKRLPFLWAAWLIYLGTSLPTAGIFTAGQQIVADRYGYFPNLPWATLLGLSVLYLPGEHHGPLRWGWVILTAGMITGLAALCWRQQAIWRNAETLWTRTVVSDPYNYPAHLYLAGTLVLKNRESEAISLLMKATRLREEAPDAWFDLGKIELGAGRHGHAVIAFRKTLEVAPAHREAARLLKDALLNLEKQKNQKNGEN